MYGSSVTPAGIPEAIRRSMQILATHRALFGRLDEIDVGAAVQLKSIDVDLIRSNNHPLFQVALERQRVIGAWNVPRTEVLVILKFLAAVSPWRDRVKRRQDVTDISYLYEVVGSELDRDLMLELSRMVYPGAERAFGELLGKIERGESIAI